MSVPPVSPHSRSWHPSTHAPIQGTASRSTWQGHKNSGHFVLLKVSATGQGTKTRTLEGLLRFQHTRYNRDSRGWTLLPEPSRDFCNLPCAVPHEARCSTVLEKPGVGRNRETR